MTKGEARKLDTEAVIFPMSAGRDNREIGLSDTAVGNLNVEEKSIRIDVKDRFARLKKSLRRRSVSIL
ncbi:MAG: hypothetical protein LH472_16405 [Pyrinomonadaceae bacterium]|nr:hypothetical protein [Pyrinomonadaceae bacterium]